MKRIPWGKLVLILGAAAVLYVIGTVVFLLYSGRTTSKYQVYLRLAFDAAEVSGAGVQAPDGDGWRTIDSETADKFYYYMSSHSSVTLRRGARSDGRAFSLRIGDDIATVTPLSAENDDTAIVVVTLAGKTYRIRVTAEGLWSRMAQFLEP